jgi:HSP20 family molecular chaperone IbpA
MPSQDAQRISPRAVTVTPHVDIFQHSQCVTLRADRPGVTMIGLEGSIHDGTLYIEADSVLPTPTGVGLQPAEVRESRFARAFTLSAEFDSSKIDANLQARLS